MDWVEERATREATIRNEKRQQWNDLCEAIERAVMSFRKYYSDREKRRPEFERSRSNENLVWVVVRSLGDRPEEKTMHLRNEAGSWIRASISGSKPLEIKVDLTNTGEGCLLVEGKQVSVDMCSRLILEPLLFDITGSGLRSTSPTPDPSS